MDVKRFHHGTESDIFKYYWRTLQKNLKSVSTLRSVCFSRWRHAWYMQFTFSMIFLACQKDTAGACGYSGLNASGWLLETLISLIDATVLILWDRPHPSFTWPHAHFLTHLTGILSTLGNHALWRKGGELELRIFTRCETPSLKQLMD